MIRVLADPGRNIRSAVGENRGLGAGKEAVMARTAGIGMQNFREIIENSCFYVNKIDFI